MTWKNIVFDIETSSIFEKTIHMRMWGILDIDSGLIKTGVSGTELEPYIRNAECIIGYNQKAFDLPVIEQYNIAPSKWCNIVDLYEVLAPRPLKEGDPKGKGRAAIIGELRLDGLKDNRFPNLKLGTVIKHLKKVFKDRYKFENLKGEYDYKKLNGPLTKEDLQELKVYLEGDLLATRDLYNFFDDYFSGFQVLLPPETKGKNIHITASTASIGYKALCHNCDLLEAYGDHVSMKRPGAFVLEPQGQIFLGDGRCVDFASQHPHHQWSANLFTPVHKCEHKVNGMCPNPYKGDGKIFNLDGTYCSCAMGKIEKFIRKLYFKRLFYKRKAIMPDSTEVKYVNLKVNDKFLFINEDTFDLETIIITEDNIKWYHDCGRTGTDAREYTIKIIINAIYGVSYSPVFLSTYNATTGRDTINMSIQSTAFMMKWFTDHGYEVVYSDTDSAYVFDPFKNEERLLRIMEEGVSKIRDALPFVDPTYNMTVDAEYGAQFFPKDPSFKPMKKVDEKNKLYLKKSYIYIDHLPENIDQVSDEDLEKYFHIKGTQIVKATCTQLSKHIFKKYLLRPMVTKYNFLFDKDYIRRCIDTEIRNDVTLVAQRFSVKPTQHYAWTGILNYHISKKYGEGVHFLIKNAVMGVGQGVKYCTINEAKKLPLSAIDLTKTWSELSPFIKEEHKQEDLGKWF